MRRGSPAAIASGRVTAVREKSAAWLLPSFVGVQRTFRELEASRSTLEQDPRSGVLIIINILYLHIFEEIQAYKGRRGQCAHTKRPAGPAWVLLFIVVHGSVRVSILALHYVARRAALIIVLRSSASGGKVLVWSDGSRRHRAAARGSQDEPWRCVRVRSG